MNDYISFLARTIAIFFAIMILIRVLGKREVGQLSIFDLVILLIIADIGAMGIEKKETFWLSILSFLILLILQKGFAILLLKKAKIRDLIDGVPKVLVHNGAILYEVLKKEKYNIDDLVMQTRLQGIMDINTIALAILETSGDLSIFLKEDVKDLFLPIIISGHIDENFCKLLKIDKNDVLNMLEINKLELKNTLYALSNGKILRSVKLVNKA